MAQKKNYFPVVVSGSVVALFLALMTYALRHDPNSLPSQLINKSAPMFTASLAQGGQFNLQDNLGKSRWIVLNFWTTTCVVCREEAPELQRFYQDVAGQGGNSPQFVSINTQETTAEILGYLRDLHLTYPVVSDKSGKISLDYGVYGTPETFFIDPDGKVRHRVAGEVDKESILRFIDFLEKNPNISAIDAMQGFAQVRRHAGG